MSEFQKANKVMLVCSDPADLVDSYLRSVKAEIVKVKDGESAISHAHRSNFDLVIVFSTGKIMDEAETVLNLRDIRASAEIIMIREGCGSAADVISHVFPNTRAMTLKSLGAYLEH